MERRLFVLKKNRKISALFLVVGMILTFVSCGDESKGEEKKIANPTPQSVVESFYTAWEKSDTKTIISLTCEPIWETEAKSANVSVAELKEILKQGYAEESGSEVYYKILDTKEYNKDDKEYKDVLKWAKERYSIDIEGYAVVRVAVTYDKGEPITEKMEIIKYEGSWYARDLLGI